MAQFDEDDVVSPDDVLSPLYELNQQLSIREKLLDLLLEKLKNDRHPSSTMMDHIESLLTPWRRQEYANILMDKIRQDRHPSPSMIERLTRMAKWSSA